MEQLAEVVEYALVIVQPEPTVIAGSVVMTLVVVVMVGPVEYALVLPPLVVLVVMMAGPVEMAKLVEYALMPPPLVVVVVLARYDSKQQ
jgi:hypothetical protein